MYAADPASNINRTQLSFKPFIFSNSLRAADLSAVIIPLSDSSHDRVLNL